MRRGLIGALALAASAACGVHRSARTRAPGTELRADSAGYAVRFDRNLFRTDIGYSFTNYTGGTVSLNHCNAPSPPLLEKEVSPGHWVQAYSAVELMCQTLPPFRLASGETYHGALHAYGAPRAGSSFVGWQVDTIPGTYRLQWSLHASANPDDRAGTITVVSPSFQLRVP